MAISNFIPTVWSENLYKNLDKQYIAVANCNRDFEGEIKECGSTVKVNGIGDITVNNYSKNVDMINPQALSGTNTELVIDQAKYFNFQIDDIDKAQCSPKLMDAAMSKAASALANLADKYVYELYDETENMVEAMLDENNSNIIDYIIKAREILYENNVSDSSGVVLEVSPAVASLILKAKIALSNDNAEALETGCIGSIAGCKIFVSNNIATFNGAYQCMMRTKRAITFAEQLSEIVAYRPEKRFADALKGLHLYGASLMYPNELVVISVKV